MVRLSLKHVANGGSVAEEVISTVRTAKAFGSQQKLSAMYDANINQSREADLGSSVVLGCGLSVFFFVIYSAYALAFDFGSRLLNQGHADVSAVLNVFFAILIGSFSLAMMAPEMQGKFAT